MKYQNMDTGQVQSVPQTPHHFLGTLLPLVDFEQNSFLRGSQGSMRIENEVLGCFRKFFPSLQSNYLKYEAGNQNCDNLLTSNVQEELTQEHDKICSTS